MIDNCFLWFKSHAMKSKGSLFVITCWIIWKSRNAEIFSDKRWENWPILSHIGSLLSLTVKLFGQATAIKILDLFLGPLQQMIV